MQPPSTGIAIPVTSDAAGEHNHTTADFDSLKWSTSML
jgi:hypothetical protein